MAKVEGSSRFSTDSAKSKIDKFSESTNWVKSQKKQHRSEELLNTFAMNDTTYGFCSWNKKLENFYHQRYAESGSQRANLKQKVN